MSTRPDLVRVSPRAAYQEVLWDDARLVDVRSLARRTQAGEIHPVLRPDHVSTDALEQCLDPRGTTRLPWASYDARVLVMGHDGDEAAPVADWLRRLGLWRTAYVRGGFTAWAADGMPVARACRLTVPSSVPSSVVAFHAGDVAAAAV